MATLKDIAEHAGVSVGTVDRILHNRGRFSAETAERVRRISEELDYRPNLMARHLSRSSECCIGLLSPEPSQDSGYWSLPLLGARRAERELEGLGLRLVVAHFDRYKPESFRSAGKRFLQEAFDGILMAPLQDGEARLFLDRLPPDVPVMFFDTDLQESRRMSYIGQDSYRSGLLAARLLSLAAGAGGNQSSGPEPGKKRKLLVVAPAAENEHLDSRIAGFSEGLDTDTELRHLRVKPAFNGSTFEASLDLHLGAGLDGIFVADASAHFVAESLYQRSRTALPLIGYDLVDANRKWMERGVIDFLLTQRPVEQGYDGVNRLFRKVFQDEDAPDHLFTPIDIVTRENLEYLNPEENA